MKSKTYPLLLSLLAASLFVALTVPGQVTKPFPSQGVLIRKPPIPVNPAPQIPEPVQPSPAPPATLLQVGPGEPISRQLPGFTNQLRGFTNQLPGFTNELRGFTNQMPRFTNRMSVHTND